MHNGLCWESLLFTLFFTSENLYLGLTLQKNTEWIMLSLAPYCSAYPLCSSGDSVQSSSVVSIGVLNPDFKRRLHPECVSRANAITCESWTALKGTSGWRASLLLQSLKQRRITAVAFGWRWFSMELDALYGTQLGTVWQSYPSCCVNTGR